MAEKSFIANEKRGSIMRTTDKWMQFKCQTHLHTYISNRYQPHRKRGASFKRSNLYKCKWNERLECNVVHSNGPTLKKPKLNPKCKFQMTAMGLKRHSPMTTIYSHRWKWDFYVFFSPQKRWKISRSRKISHVQLSNFAIHSRNRKKWRTLNIGLYAARDV